LGLLAAGWAAFAVLGASWWQLLTAAYVEASLFGSYAEAIRHLHTVGAPLRPTVAAAD
jgi:hypothetical protein